MLIPTMEEISQIEIVQLVLMSFILGKFRLSLISESHKSIHN